MTLRAQLACHNTRVHFNFLYNYQMKRSIFLFKSFVFAI